MIEDKKLKQDMMIILGMLEAASYPLCSGDGNSPYYDLIDTIKEQYISIIKRTVGYEE